MAASFISSTKPPRRKARAVEAKASRHRLGHKGVASHPADHVQGRACVIARPTVRRQTSPGSWRPIRQYPGVVTVDKNFGIGLALETVTLPFQRSAQVAKIIDGPVKDDSRLRSGDIIGCRPSSLRSKIARRR